MCSYVESSSWEAKIVKDGDDDFYSSFYEEVERRLWVYF